MSDMATDLGFTIQRSTSRTGRGYVRVTAPDGRAVSFYDAGDLRLYKEGHLVELRDANPESTYVEFVPPARDVAPPRARAARRC